MSHDGGFTCAQVDKGSQDMADSIMRLRKERDAALRAYDAEVIGRRDEVTRLHAELRGEREKYRQVVEINHANQKSYWAETDKLRAEFNAALAALDRNACRRCGDCRDQPHHWLTSMPECPEGGEPYIACQHCPARAAVCNDCGEGAVWPPILNNKRCELCNAPGGV